MDIVLKYEGVWQVLFSAELFRKSAVIFPEISGNIPPEISELNPSRMHITSLFLVTYGSSSSSSNSRFVERITRRL